ncbi:preprotein translocase subunit SecG, partial [Treponema endosymbiont of Eucomonympha sp.]|uniref:preprotein translocase subunit SecG n=1 Tax=Treponema endosymbiont of Eucomonympha sp. TaxID=1580831 RepID=UPI001E3E55C9
MQFTGAASPAYGVRFCLLCPPRSDFMGFIGVILLVAFVIICVLLICLVMVQDDGSGVGGIFGGSNSAAFGSRSGSVLTRTPYGFVALLI